MFISTLNFSSIFNSLKILSNLASNCVSVPKFLTPFQEKIHPTRREERQLGLQINQLSTSLNENSYVTPPLALGGGRGGSNIQLRINLANIF